MIGVRSSLFAEDRPRSEPLAPFAESINLNSRSFLQQRAQKGKQGNIPNVHLLSSHPNHHECFESLWNIKKYVRLHWWLQQRYQGSIFLDETSFDSISQGYRAHRIMASWRKDLADPQVGMLHSNCPSSLWRNIELERFSHDTSIVWIQGSIPGPWLFSVLQRGTFQIFSVIDHGLKQFLIAFVYFF